MKENILILVNSFISCSKKQYFKTQLINTEHRTQNTDTEHRTQTHVKNGSEHPADAHRGAHDGCRFGYGCDRDCDCVDEENPSEEARAQ